MRRPSSRRRSRATTARPRSASSHVPPRAPRRVPGQRSAAGHRVQRQLPRRPGHRRRAHDHDRGRAPADGQAVARGRRGRTCRPTARPTTASRWPATRSASSAGSATSAPAPSPGSRSWEFAEGSTRAPVPHRPSSCSIRASRAPTSRFTFRLEQGGTRSQTLHLPASSRVAFDPRDVVPAADFATSISADRPIVAERAYASSGDGLYGALGYTASPPRNDSRAWYFAEGNTPARSRCSSSCSTSARVRRQVRGTYFVDGGLSARAER